MVWKAVTIEIASRAGRILCCITEFVSVYVGIIHARTRLEFDHDSEAEAFRIGHIV